MVMVMGDGVIGGLERTHQHDEQTQSKTTNTHTNKTNKIVQSSKRARGEEQKRGRAKERYIKREEEGKRGT